MGFRPWPPRALHACSCSTPYGHHPRSGGARERSKPSLPPQLPAGRMEQVEYPTVLVRITGAGRPRSSQRQTAIKGSGDVRSGGRQLPTSAGSARHCSARPRAHLPNSNEPGPARNRGPFGGRPSNLCANTPAVHLKPPDGFEAARILLDPAQSEPTKPSKHPVYPPHNLAR